MTTATIWEGILIGVSAGFVAGSLLSVAIGLKDWLFRRLERREQIRYLASFMENYINLIYHAEDIDARSGPIGRIIPKPEVQKPLLDAWWRELQSVFSDRSSRLSFDEIQQVKLVFAPLQLYPNLMFNDHQFGQTLNDLRAIKWLKLSKVLRDQ